MTDIVWLEETATLAQQYETMIRQAAQELWRGNYTRPGFVRRMMTIVRDGMTRAWFQGMADVKLKPEDMSDAERQVLGTIITGNQRYIQDFANWIYLNNRGRGGKWQPISNRVKLWGNRYADARNRAKAMAQSDPPLEWVLGSTKEHCQTCAKLSGKVKRSSYWYRVNILPQNPPNGKLACGGWRCQCTLEPTDKPLSKGRLPGE